MSSGKKETISDIYIDKLEYLISVLVYLVSKAVHGLREEVFTITDTIAMSTSICDGALIVEASSISEWPKDSKIEFRPSSRDPKVGDHVDFTATYNISPEMNLIFIGSIDIAESGYSVKILDFDLVPKDKAAVVKTVNILIE